MKAILLRIESILGNYFENSLKYKKKAQKANKKKRWLDASTTKHMLDVGDRMLYNYVQRGELIAEKRGNANVYLESSILKLIERQGRKK